MKHARAKPVSLRVCVYYDAGRDSSYTQGHLNAIMMENLLGHFREAVVSLDPVEQYAAAGLDACDRAAYIGSFFDAALPEGFLRDVAAYKKPFLWAGYNIGELEKAMGTDAFRAKSGFSYQYVAGFDVVDSTDAIPDFFKFFDYKGERFTKEAFRNASGAISAAPDIGFIANSTARVLSTATHSGNGMTTPYITEKNDFFYVADNPFLFIHEQDRYLIFADVLFDFLKLAPRSQHRYAVVRLEDIHPHFDLRLLYKTVDLLKTQNVPFGISLIPEYIAAGSTRSSVIDLGQRPGFVKAIRYAQDNGGVVLMHGDTHDVSGLEGCPGLGTGFDYEFWDRCHNTTLPYDSEKFTVDKIVRAKALLAGVGLSAEAWVTPHYAASSIDSAVFAKQFDRTLQRVTYLVDNPSHKTPDAVDQFFPYTIYKDHYGQYIWPEDLGFVPFPGADWGDDREEDIATSARLERVVRDSWASFYWHPLLIDTPGEPEHLKAMIDSIRASGFEFVSLKSLRARGE